MSSQPERIIERLRELGNPEIAGHSQRFFKTGPGEYGEGDIFLGIRVPVIRKCVREFRETAMEDCLDLLCSPFHEVRLFALLLMVEKYRSATAGEAREAIYNSYLDNTAHINNWDLVDCSAEHIIGAFLVNRDRTNLFNLAVSRSLWERRIAIMSTFHFIRKGDFTDTLAIAEILLNDRNDLIHKAVGWMLRELGKRNLDVEREFLDRHGQEMPRTMLRYAIERFPKEERLSYLHKGKRKF